MQRDPIFHALSPAALVQVARYLSFSPLVTGESSQRLVDLDPDVQSSWLNQHRLEVEDEFCSVGSSTFGITKDYPEIVRDLAEKLSVSCLGTADVATFERAILTKVWNDAVGRLTPEQVARLRSEAEQLAAKHGTSLGKEVTGFAALGAAQLSGFGVYLLGSTVLGAINGALGLGLGFGAFTGLSSLISIVIGPIGWAALGLTAIVKLGAPNFKKVLPVVILIAINRQLISESEMEGARAKISSTGTSDSERILQIAMETSPLRHFKFMREHPNLALAMTPGHTFAVLNREAYNQVFGANNKAAAAAPNTISSVVKAKDFPVVVEGALQELQSDIEQCAEHLRSNEVLAEGGSNRKATQRERRIFALKHPELCRVAAELESDYLDMTPSEQKVVRDLARERDSFAEHATSTEVGASAQAQNSGGSSSTDPSGPGNNRNEKRGAKHLQQEMKKTRAEFRYTLHTIEFANMALEYLCSQTPQDRLPFISELSRMNRGFLDGKHPIRGTNPKVFELEAGKSGRIYYRRQEGTNPVLVERLGNKHTQNSDCEALRANTVF